MIRLTMIALLCSVMSGLVFADGDNTRGLAIPDETASARVSRAIKDLNDGVPAEPELTCHIETITGSHLFRRVCTAGSSADEERAQAMAYLAGAGTRAEYSTARSGTRAATTTAPGGTGGGGYCSCPCAD